MSCHVLKAQPADIAERYIVSTVSMNCIEKSRKL